MSIERMVRARQLAHAVVIQVSLARYMLMLLGRVAGKRTAKLLARMDELLVAVRRDLQKEFGIEMEG